MALAADRARRPARQVDPVSGDCHFDTEQGSTASMPSPWWLVFAGVALLALALVVTFLFGRDLAQTRVNLASLQRMLQNTRRLNDDVVAASKSQSPSIAIVKAEKQSEFKTWLDK
jgi:hypothetical protein